MKIGIHIAVHSGILKYISVFSPPCHQRPLHHVSMEPILQTVHEDMIENCENSYCSNSNNNYQIRSQCCTCHNCSAVVTCAKLLADLIVIFQARSTFLWFFMQKHHPCFFFTRFRLWVPVTFESLAPEYPIVSYMKQSIQSTGRVHYSINGLMSLCLIAQEGKANFSETLSKENCWMC